MPNPHKVSDRLRNGIAIANIRTLRNQQDLVLGPGSAGAGWSRRIGTSRNLGASPASASTSNAARSSSCNQSGTPSTTLITQSRQPGPRAAHSSQSMRTASARSSPVPLGAARRDRALSRPIRSVPSGVCPIYRCPPGMLVRPCARLFVGTDRSPGRRPDRLPCRRAGRRAEPNETQAWWLNLTHRASSRWAAPLSIAVAARASPSSHAGSHSAWLDNPV